MKLKLLRISFDNLSLQKKIFWYSVFISVLILSIVSFKVFPGYYEFHRNKTLRVAEILSLQVAEKLETYIQEVGELTKQPVYDLYYLSAIEQNIDIMGILSHSNRSGAKKSDEFMGYPIDNGYSSDSVFSYAEQRVLLALINKVMISKDDISSVFIYNKLGDRIYRTKSSQQVSSYDIVNEAWFNKCIELNGSVLVDAPKESSTGRTFTISRALRDYNYDVVGIMCIDTEISFLSKTLKNIINIAGESLMIFENNSRLICNVGEIGADGLGGLNLDEIESGKYVDVMLNNEKMLLYKIDLKNVDWQIVRLLPINILFEQERWNISELLIIFIGCIVLSIFISKLVAGAITKPLSALVATMNKIKDTEHMSVSFECDRNDEIGLLSASFNAMVKRMDYLVNTVQETRLKEKEAELTALWMQINPHFIYNTLETIRMNSVLNDDKSTSEMISMLGKMLRYNIKSNKTTIADEIDNISNYITLLNYRFSDRYQMHVDIEPDILHVSIAKLMFQPIVENSIVHGFEESQTKCIITIRSYYENSKIIIDIADNGMGMTSDALEDLLIKINTPKELSEKRGIGLRNINERLKLNYGESFGLRVYSEVNKGTLIKLTMPNGSALSHE